MFVTSDVMLEKFICWTRSCDFVMFSNFFVNVKFIAYIA